MDKKELAVKVVDHMFEKDRFSQWLGIERVVVDAGKSVLKMAVREEMLNGFDVIHGGVTYSLADTAFAFASNAHGRLSMALDTSMSYPAPVKVGDILTATAEEISLTNRTGIYDIRIRNQDDVIVGVFRGTVYRTSKEYFPSEKKE